MPLNKPSDFFEQKENEENLSDEKTKVETQKRILSPSGLLDEKEEVVVEENIEEEVVVDNTEDKNYQKIIELEKLVEQVKSQVSSIPKVIDYRKDIGQLSIELDRLRKAFGLSEAEKLLSKPVEFPEIKSYDEDIELLHKLVADIERKQEIVSLSEGLLDEPNSDSEKNFATLEDLSEHYRLFVNRIQQQLSTLGGGGIEDAPKSGGPYVRQGQKWIASSSSDGDWIRDSVGINTTDSVGIGTTAATAALTVRSSAANVDSGISLESTAGLQIVEIGQTGINGGGHLELKRSGSSSDAQLNVGANNETASNRGVMLWAGNTSNDFGRISIISNTETDYHNVFRVVSAPNSGSSKGTKLIFTSDGGAEFARSGDKTTINQKGLTSGIITATSFFGDGSNLTGVIAGIGTTASINTSGIITASVLSSTTGTFGTVNVSGVSTFLNDVHMKKLGEASSHELIFGIDAVSALKISHTGTNGSIFNLNGDLLITSTDVGGGTGAGISMKAFDDITLSVRDGEDGINIIGDGAVELYYDNSKKFETTGYGVTVYGGVNVSGASTFSDEVSFGSTATFGTSSQNIQIYNDSSGTPNSTIKETGSGEFRILGNKMVLKNSADTKIFAEFVNGGSAKLYYNNSEKFRTTGIGVSILNGTSETATIYGPSNLIIDPMPVGVGTTSGIVRIKGDLYVDGTTTTINSTTVEIADKVIGIATTCNTNLLTDGAGIGIGSDKTFLYHYNSGTNPSLKSSENLNIASGKGYQINQTEVLNATTLGSGVTVSSLTSVGTLGSLNVSGISTFQSDVKIGVGGTVASFDVSGGKLGIGVVNPNTKLHIKGSGAPGIRIQDEDGTQQHATFIENNGQLFINSRNNTSRGTIAFRGENSTDAEEFMRITSTGDVGIGTNNPTELLHLESGHTKQILKSTNLNTASFLVFDTHNINTVDFLLGRIAGKWNGNDVAYIQFEAGSDTTNKDDGVITFLTSPASSTPAERLRIDSSGRLLVGTTSSSGDHILEVNSGTDNEGIKVVSTDGGSYIRFADNSTTAQIRLGAVGDDFKIDVNASERLRIDSNGDVGIGTDNPTAKLDVVGNAKVTGIITATSFSGDGSALTGITAGIGTTGSINTSGIITATSFSGDGSNLTGITAGIGTTGSINTSGIITATSFSGPLTGNVTGDVTGTATTASTIKIQFTTTNTAHQLLFVDKNDIGSTDQTVFCDSTMAFNPSANLLTVANLNVSSAGGLSIDEDQVTSTADELNILDGVTATTAELNLVDGTTVGSAVASKALAVDASRGIDNLGIVTATSFSGDGSNLTGVIAGIGTTASINTSGIITATSFSGDGSALTGIASAVWSTNGNEAYYTSGNVGIGTTNPNVTLDVNGKVNVFGSDGNGYSLTIDPSSSGGTYETLIGKQNGDLRLLAGAGFYQANRANILLKNNGNLELSSDSSSDIIFKSNTVEKVRIDSAGKVGIGTNDPQQLLHVNNGSSNAIIQITSSDTKKARVRFGDQTSDLRGEIQYDNSDDSLAFKTNGLLERLRITSNGNVGIGTTVPAVSLDIRNTQPTLRLYDTDATNAYTNLTNLNGNMYLGARNDSSNGVLLFGGYGGGTFTEFFRASSTAFTIDTNGNERFRITSAGNVGIGSTQPTAKLDVNGTLNVSGVSTLSNDIDVKRTDGSIRYINFYDQNGGNQGSIQQAADGGSGSLRVYGKNLLRLASDADVEIVDGQYNTKRAVFGDAGVELYSGVSTSSTKKFETTGYGVTVYGGVNVSGVSTFKNDVQFHNAAGLTTVFFDQSDETLKFSDSAQLRFGDGGDLQLFHNGSASLIRQTGTGSLFISNTTDDEDIVINTDDGSGGTANYFRADGSTGEAILYHYGTQKFATKSNGIDVTGHTETDTLNVSGLSTFNDSVDIEGVNSILDVKEGTIYTTEVQGNNRELYIRGGGSQSTRPTIHLPNTTNPLSILGNSSNTQGIVIDSRSTGVVDIKHNSSTKLQTTASGIDVTGLTETDTLNVSGLSTFQDDVLIAVNNKKLTFGTGSNLQIYHIDNTDGSVIDATSNVLTIGAGNFQIKNSAGTVTSAHFRSSFGQDLYYNNSLKFVTTGIGVSIANGTSDTATIAGPETLILDPAAVGDNTGTVRIKGDFIVDGTTTTVNSTIVDIADKVIGIATTCSSDLLTDGAGIGIGTNKTFLYEHNSGTNPSLKASENLNVPTGKGYQVNQVEVLNATTLGSSVVNSSLTSVGTLGALTVSGDVSIADKIIHTGDTNTAIRFPAADTFTVETAGTERVRVDSDGDVGVGIADPKTKLHVARVIMATGATPQIRLNANDSDLSDNDRSMFGQATGNGHFVDTAVDNDTILRGTSTGNLLFGIGTTEKFRIASDGKFGFGTGSSIDERGHIETSTGTCRLKIQTGDTSVAGFVLQTSAIRFDIQAQNNFFQIYDNTVDEERLRITSAGNVGIGTLSPTQKLDVAGNIAIKETTVVGSATSSLSTVSQTAIHSAPIATYRSVEYTIQATQGTNFHVTKILAVHDGTTAYNSEYGTIFNNSSVATFDTDVSGGNLRLLATGASASQTDYVINFVGTKV